MDKHSGSVMYQRDNESEKLRNEIEMRKLRQKLVNIRPKPETVKKFESLIKDDKNMMKNIYPVKLSEIIGTLYTPEQQCDEEDYTVLSENNYSAGGHPNEDSRNITKASDNEDDVSISIDFNLKPQKLEDDNITENDFQHERESTIEFGYDESKIKEEGEYEVGEGEYFAGTDNESTVTKMTYYDKDSLATEQPLQLTPLEAFGVACVLEKWIDRISILDVMDGLENEKSNLAAKEYERFESNKSKLSNLRKFMSQTLKLNVQELRLSGTFNTLQRANDSMEQTIRDEQELEIECLANRNALNVWRNKKKRYKQRHHVEKWRFEMKIQDLAEEYERITRLLETENEYVRTWQDRWSNENKEILKEEESNLHKKIQIIDNESKMEEHCMEEAKHMFTEYTETIKRLTQIWETIYTKDVGAIDIDILTLEQEAEDLDDIHKHVRMNAEELQTLINEFEGRKHEREERIRYKEYLNNMATRIQAAWRGTMVRKFLGPYKKLKKLFKKKPVKKNNKTKKSKKK